MTSQRSTLFGGRKTVLWTLGPATLLFAVFILVPAIRAFSVSLYSWSGYSPESSFVGFDNYRALLDDEHFTRSLWNTLYYVVVGGFCHITLAFLFAWALHHPRLRGKKVFQTIIFFPAFVSVVAIGVLWTQLYEPQHGLLALVSQTFGVDAPVWLSPRNGMNSIIAASVWAGVGSHMIILMAGLKRIPKTLLDTARLDGASELAIFWHITLPMLRNVTYAAVALWLVGAMQVFGLVQVLVPHVPELQTVSTYHYAISFNARDNIYMMGRGTAMAVVLLLSILFLAGAVRLVFAKQRIEY